MFAEIVVSALGFWVCVDVVLVILLGLFVFASWRGWFCRDLPTPSAPERTVSPERAQALAVQAAIAAAMDQATTKDSGTDYVQILPNGDELRQTAFGLEIRSASNVPPAVPPASCPSGLVPTLMQPDEVALRISQARAAAAVRDAQIRDAVLAEANAAISPESRAQMLAAGGQAEVDQFLASVVDGVFAQIAARSRQLAIDTTEWARTSESNLMLLQGFGIADNKLREHDRQYAERNLGEAAKETLLLQGGPAALEAYLDAYADRMQQQRDADRAARRASSATSEN